MRQGRQVQLSTLERRVAAIEQQMQDFNLKEEFLERLKRVEDLLNERKSVLTMEEACRYLGVSHSSMYKLTSAKAIPHYKPRGKMIFFDRLELETWAKRSGQVSIAEATECMACIAAKQQQATTTQQ